MIVVPVATLLDSVAREVPKLPGITQMHGTSQPLGYGRTHSTLRASAAEFLDVARRPCL